MKIQSATIYTTRTFTQKPNLAEPSKRPNFTGTGQIMIHDCENIAEVVELAKAVLLRHNPTGISVCHDILTDLVKAPQAGVTIIKASFADFVDDVLGNSIFAHAVRDVRNRVAKPPKVNYAYTDEIHGFTDEQLSRFDLRPNYNPFPVASSAEIRE